MGTNSSQWTHLTIKVSIILLHIIFFQIFLKESVTEAPNGTSDTNVNLALHGTRCNPSILEQR